MIFKEPFEIQFCLKLPQLMGFPNGDIQPFYGIPRKVKRKKMSAVSFMCLLQNNGDNDKSMSVPGTQITQRRLGFKDDEGTDTDTHTGGDIGEFTSATKDDGTYGTPSIERLLHSEGTSDTPIISWFDHVYMLDSTALFDKEMGTGTSQLLAPRTVIDSADIVC